LCVSSKSDNRAQKNGNFFEKSSSGFLVKWKDADDFQISI
jgi:hypothetical protein